jgi:ferredoxin/flavodoxin
MQEMSVEIHYFSGTGNSLFLARILAEMTKGSIKSIALEMRSKSIEIHAETAGVVFPVYYGNVPAIVQHFIGKLNETNGKYVFVVYNYGGGSGDSARTVRSILRKHGGMLSAAFGIHMPQNSFLKPWEVHPKINERARKKCAVIASRILECKKGRLLPEVMYNVAMSPLHTLLFKPLYRRLLEKKSGSPPGLGMEELIHSADKDFESDEKCNGCAICVDVCPVQNIQMKEQRPEWRGACENCLACYNWCPKRAIQGGIAHPGYYYRHAEVTAKDMILSPRSN